jgi:hypothetical protein
MDPTQEPMSVDTFVALVMLAVIAGAALLYAGSKLYFWMATGTWNVSSLTDADERDYVAPRRRPIYRTEWAEPALNSAEPPRPVRPEQLRTDGEAGPLSISEIETLDRLGQLFASKALSSEAAAIEAFFPGIKRGGSKRYLQLRDHLRAAAIRHGWQAPEPPAPSAGAKPLSGNPRPPGVVYAGEDRPEAIEAA